MRIYAKFLGSGSVLLLLFAVSCSSLSINEACGDTWQGEKKSIDSVFSRQWISGTTGLIIQKEKTDSGTASSVIVYEYDCSGKTCRKTGEQRFDFGRTDNQNLNPYSWNENSVVMAERWTITLLTDDKFAYRSSYGGNCTFNYVLSEKTFVDG